MLKALNNDKFFLGICMIIFNLGSKYLVIDLSKSHEAILKHTIARRITLFAIFFVATRDLFTSLILTAVFIVLALNLFNEQSKFNIMPATFFDNKYTLEEYNMAKKIIHEVEKKGIMVHEESYN